MNIVQFFSNPAFTGFIGLVVGAHLTFSLTAWSDKRRWKQEDRVRSQQWAYEEEVKYREERLRVDTDLGVKTSLAVTEAQGTLAHDIWSERTTHIRSPVRCRALRSDVSLFC